MARASAGGLTALQRRVLTELSGLTPPWTLTGGAALVGVHGVHRTTRDLDLLFHGVEHLADVPRAVAARLTDTGLEVTSIQTSEAFHRLRVSDGVETVLLDLVADPVPVVEAPSVHYWGDASVLVDTPHEILVNKLCALVHRAEIRDLSDVSSLLAAGGDLERALGDAPRKEAGFSPLTLAWLLRGLPIDSLVEASGMDRDAARRLAAFRDQLVARVMERSRPDT